MENMCKERYGDLPKDVAITIAPIAFALNKIQLQDFYADTSYFVSTLVATKTKLQTSDDFLVRAYVNGFFRASRLLEVAYTAAMNDPRGFRDCVNIELEQLWQVETFRELATRLREKLLEARMPKK
ncbi:MAG: hypothetical protein QXT13_13330 [Pyrobaculum sp.]